MRGSIRKRCQCRDEEGRPLKQCRKAHGSWSFVVDAGYDPRTGRRRQIRRSGYRTRDEANEAMTRELASLAGGTWTDDQGLRLDAWLDQWLAEFAARGRSPKTLALYTAHVTNFWRPQLGHIRLRDLRRGHVEAAVRVLTQPQAVDRKAGKSRSEVVRLSPLTIDGYRRTLRAALSAAKRRDLISTNPAEGRMDSIPDRVESDDLKIWEPEDTARFLEHVSHDRLSVLYELAAYGGLRRGELCGLRWSDVDADGTGIEVRQTIVELTRSQARPGDLICPTCGREHVGRHFKRPKSRVGRRWVPLAPSAQVALKAHREAQAEERAMFGTDYRDHGLIFCNVDGDPLRPGVLSREFKSHSQACGLPLIRLHDMRHGACSLMLSGGVPIEVVQMILGHSSPAVTRKVYAHLMKRATAEQFAAGTQRLTDRRRDQSVTNRAESDGSAETTRAT
jgi:integrase